MGSSSEDAIQVVDSINASPGRLHYLWWPARAMGTSSEDAVQVVDSINASPGRLHYLWCGPPGPWGAPLKTRSKLLIPLTRAQGVFTTFGGPPGPWGPPLKTRSKLLIPLTRAQGVFTTF